MIDWVVMVGAAAAIVAIALALGMLLPAAAGLEAWSWTLPVAGFAGAIVLAGAGTDIVRQGGAALVAAALVAAAVVIWRTGRSALPGAGRAVASAALCAAIACVPFALSGRVGALGFDVNGDLPFHIVWSAWLEHGTASLSGGIYDGYPLGAHSLVAALGVPASTSPTARFSGLLIAVPALSGMGALAAARDLGRIRTAVLAILVALPYLGASYFAEGAFKETIMGLLVFAFGLALADGQQRWSGGGRYVPAAVIAAGAFYVYGFACLAWFAAALGGWAVLELVAVRRRPALRAFPVRSLLPLAIAAAVAIVAVIPELPRAVAFLSSQPANAPDTGTGNLLAALPFRESFGIWLKGDFRLVPSGTLAGVVLPWLAGALTVCGAGAWAVRRDRAVPAAALAAALVALLGGATRNEYMAAKALAIASPVFMLVMARWLLTPVVLPRAGRLGPAFGAAAAVVLAAALASSLFAVRYGQVDPGGRHDELARIDAVTRGASVLYLARDPYGPSAMPLSHVEGTWDAKQFPDVAFRAGTPPPGSAATGFDTVTARTLNRFRYLVTTRSPVASSPPANLERVLSTGSYVLWKRTGTVPDRQTLPELLDPWAPLDCSSAAGAQIAAGRGRAAVMNGVTRGSWAPAQVLTGTSFTSAIDIPPGRWTLTLQYNGPTAATVTADGVRARLPASGEILGSAWPVGVVGTDHPMHLAVTVSVGRGNPLARLARVKRFARVGFLTAMPASRIESVVPLRRACGRLVDWYVSGASGPGSS